MGLFWTTKAERAAEQNRAKAERNRKLTELEREKNAEEISQVLDRIERLQPKWTSYDNNGTGENALKEVAFKSATGINVYIRTGGYRHAKNQTSTFALVVIGETQGEDWFEIYRREFHLSNEAERDIYQKLARYVQGFVARDENIRVQEKLKAERKQLKLQQDAKSRFFEG